MKTAYLQNCGEYFCAFSQLQFLQRGQVWNRFDQRAQFIKAMVTLKVRKDESFAHRHGTQFI
ncbi:MAG: hypothetical protein HC833_26540 [Leptolyngbyaceae cyanobacterium RM1_406_9]|nr:hypothetical protein [Leptolyngbyaceae cyanobacterium RM1_406_9]